MRLRLYGRSDVGRRRTSNEDSFVLCEEEGLGVVCDGMGGHEAGEVASRTAVDMFADRAAEAQSTLLRQRKLSRTRARAQDLVGQWTHEVNAAIHALGLESGGEGFKSRMGTTMAMMLFVSDFVVVAHVGDSRVYRVRDGLIEQLTTDHTIMAEAVRKAADPRPPRKRKYVTRALGTKSRVTPDVQLVDVLPGDLFLICSDGLTDLVEDDDIVRVLEKTQRDRRAAVRKLIQLANKRGGVDNVTVVVGEIFEDPADDSEETDALPSHGK